MGLYTLHILVFVIGLVALNCCIQAQESVSMSTLEEENKKADKAFLEWKLSSFKTLSPTIRNSLNSSNQNFLINQSSMPFGKHPSQKQLDAKVSAVLQDFLKQIGPEAAQKIDKRQLKAIIAELIKPEFVFESTTQSSSRLDKIYNALMQTLSQRLTPVGTTLKQWALRFLVAQSVFIALEAIERISFQGKSFAQLTPKGQEQLLEPVVTLITDRFMKNLETVKHQYQLVLPDRIDDAIEYKVRLFLSEKFITR